jgi:hypothetical protein
MTFQPGPRNPWILEHFAGDSTTKRLYDIAVLLSFWKYIQLYELGKFDEREFSEYCRTMSAQECMILDDEELENQQKEIFNPRDMRAWLPDVLKHVNPFESQYVSTSHAFPKVFQMKSAKEEFPKLSERVIPVTKPTMNYRSRLLQKEQMSTINILEKVRTVLTDVKEIAEKNPPEETRYSPHTPPYPFDSPVLMTASPPINEIFYPTAITPPNPTPNEETRFRKDCV